MAANVETMFYVREKPWHGLGTCVEEAPTSADALRLAGLDWEVKQRNIQVCGGAKIETSRQMSAARTALSLVLCLTAIRSCKMRRRSVLPTS